MFAFGQRQFKWIETNRKKLRDTLSAWLAIFDENFNIGTHRCSRRVCTSIEQKSILSLQHARGLDVSLACPADNLTFFFRCNLTSSSALRYFDHNLAKIDISMNFTRWCAIFEVSTPANFLATVFWAAIKSSNSYSEVIFWKITTLDTCLFRPGRLLNFWQKK